MTLTDPKIVTREPQPFAAIVLELEQPEISSKAPPLIADVIAWLNARGLRHSGPPFFNYTSFKPGGRMVMQVGMPLAEPVTGAGNVTCGVLPGGRYVSVTHHGPYHELGTANMALMDWAKAKGIVLDGEVAGDESRGATRLEIYHRDPGETDPLPTTEVAFRIKD